MANSSQGRVEVVGWVMFAVTGLALLCGGALWFVGGRRPTVPHEEHAEAPPRRVAPREGGTTAPASLVARADVRVTCIAVKEVGDRYRYFFDYRNHEPARAFEGSITIALLNSSEPGLRSGEETFITQHPVEPGLGGSVYLDIHTGPPCVHGDWGITRFRYVVKNKAGEQVATGEGAVIDDVTR